MVIKKSISPLLKSVLQPCGDKRLTSRGSPGVQNGIEKGRVCKINSEYSAGFWHSLDNQCLTL